MGRLQSIERTNIRHAWNQLFKTSGFYRTLFFLHKISKAYHKPRFQMYADVRPSQDNRVSRYFSVSCNTYLIDCWKCMLYMHWVFNEPRLVFKFCTKDFLNSFAGVEDLYVATLLNKKMRDGELLRRCYVFVPVYPFLSVNFRYSLVKIFICC